MSETYDWADLNRDHQRAVRDAVEPPSLPAPASTAHTAPEQDTAGPGAASSPAPGPVDYDGHMLADAEAKAQRALQETTITGVSAVVDMGGVRFRLAWTRPIKGWRRWF